MSKKNRRVRSKNRLIWLRIGLLLLAFPLVSACVPIPVGRHNVELKEHVSPIPLEEIRAVRVAPYYGEESLAALGKSLKKACPEAEIVPAGDLWATLFPTRDPDADAELGELIDTSGAYRSNVTYASHLIVLRQSQIDYTAPESDDLKSSPFYYQGINSATVVTTLVQLGPQAEARNISVDAEGKDTMVWFGHPLFHLSVSSKPDRKAIDAISAAIGNASDCHDSPGFRAVLLAGAEI